MNYELAKKLKDAGFKQKGNGTYLSLINASIGGKRELQVYETPNKQDNTECYYKPTLSELIDACGEYLSLWKSGDSENWICSISKNPIGYEDNYIDNDNADLKIKGKTPEEAVANLWLKLNND